MDAGLSLNAINSLDTITVVCDAQCVGTTPDGKYRRDSLQPRSDKEEENEKTSEIERLVSRGEAGGEDEEGEEGEEGEEEFSKSLLSYDPTIGEVVHDLISKKSSSIEQLILLDDKRCVNHTICQENSYCVRTFNSAKSLQRNFLDFQMYSAKTSSELAAQKSLNSFMRLASVRQILPGDLGAAFNESAQSGELDPTRMNAFNESLAFNRFTFAFGASMDSSQNLNAGLQLRPNIHVAGKGGNGILLPEGDMVVPSKPSQPEALPIRKSSLQRLNNSHSHSHETTSVESVEEEKKKSPCSYIKSGLRHLAAIFRCKPKKNVTAQPTRPFFPELPTSRPSTCSETSNASSRSKKTVRFHTLQPRVPEAYEPAFLSAPHGAVNDRKTVLTSQFGQIQYNFSTLSADPATRRSSAGSNKSHRAPGNVDNDSSASEGTRSDRSGNEPTVELADLHSFPSFSEARTGIYQRLKTLKKRGKEIKGDSVTKTKRATSTVGIHHNTVKFDTRTAEDVFFAENRPILADSHTHSRS